MQTLTPTEQSLSDDIQGVARSTSQAGMTLEGEEVQTLSGLLRRKLQATSSIALDVHRAATSPTGSGMTLEDDEVQVIASILTAA